MVGSGCFANLRIRYKLFLAYSAVLLLAGAAGTLILDSYVRRSIGAHTEAELKRSTMLVINMVRTATAVSIKNYLRAAAENNREIVNYYYQEYVTGQMGYRVVAITSSKDALQVLDSRPAEFDLIITDYTMSYLTGTELAEQIFEIRPEMPIILCTGFSEKITEKKAKDLGIKAFIMKPFDRRQLASIVRKVLDQKISKA